MRTAPHRWLLAVTAGALLYSAAHFVQSGIIAPLSLPNLAKFEEETSDLRIHLRTGEPVHSNNPVRYGPMFMLIVQPFITLTHGDEQFANWLYALQLVCVGGAF